MSDCLIVGGGVIGLSLAYELAGHGMRVAVLDSREPGREASWAGAGILPPATDDVDDPLERLTALSNRLHAAWSAELRESTHIDNGFRRTGGIYLARDARLAGGLERYAGLAARYGIVAERLSSEALAELEPALRPERYVGRRVPGALGMPDSQSAAFEGLSGRLPAAGRRNPQWRGGRRVRDSRHARRRGPHGRRVVSRRCLLRVLGSLERRSGAAAGPEG